MYKIRVLDKEPRDLHRKVLEAGHIKLRATLNHNYGYYLPLLREDIGYRGGRMPLTTAMPHSR